GKSPLHFATAMGSTEAMTALLDAGAPVDSREGAWGQTPLMWAANYDRVEAVRLLIARGADIRAVSKVGGAVMRALYLLHFLTQGSGAPG
ncbi:MAG: ankyrin repeat domain-containing protein, partial [Candidatus Omnitrophica bacterium]|nr:ankyrin repeat domain-containing protein [Candidatus Omnitrophota bacterium]